MTEDRKTIGILGGMGPLATADLFVKIIEETHARRDQDHIPVHIVSTPQIPDRSEAILHGGPSPLGPMLASARTLESSGADFIAIACNTAHYWYEEVRGAVSIPVLHIADAVVAEILGQGYRDGPIGLLGTRGTVKAGFYQKRLTDAGYMCLTPSEEAQQAIDDTIGLVKAGARAEAAAPFAFALRELETAGAGSCILACTELPLVMDGQGQDLIDANRALARYSVRWAKKA